ncbi:MAG TPA: folate hydrolase, partial [Puia sp.]
MRAALILLFLICVNSILLGQPSRLSGFSDSSSLEELKKENAFDQLVSRENIGVTIRDLSAVPHNLGSAGCKEVADKIQQKFRDYGFDVRMDIYQVLFPVPVTRILEMTSPQSY